jgi:hypothetical protein
MRDRGVGCRWSGEIQSRVGVITRKDMTLLLGVRGPCSSHVRLSRDDEDLENVKD